MTHTEDDSKYVDLHVHSQYSILEGAASVEALAAKAALYHMSALALTDQGNMYGAVEFFKACKNQGVKPIIGCELYVAPHARFDKKKKPGLPHGFPIVLLAKNKKGYQNLCRLTSLAHLEGFYYTPRIDKELLTCYAEGLICLSGPHNNSLAYYLKQNRQEELRAELLWYLDLFKDNYYLELLRHQMSEESLRAEGIEEEAWLLQLYRETIQLQQELNSTLLNLSKEFSIRCVAANNIRYITREDWYAHEILMNIQSGEPCEIWERDSFGNPKARMKNPKREVLYSHELYFKSPGEMQTLFADLPELIENSACVANACQFEFDFKTRFYPIFIPPHLENRSFTKEERLAEAEKFLRTLCEEGIPKRYTFKSLEKIKEKYPDKEPLQVVRERMEYELSIILPKGMGDYLLIVWDFIAWAKRQAIPMGPGRGSGVGSIVLYLIGVTDIEPLRFSLFFERFINPERLSYPDIDVDICMDRRSEVIDYTVRKYGKDKVAQIITFGTMKAKMAIKDVGRVLNIPLVRVNEIAKLIPEDLNMTIDKALEIDPELKGFYEADVEVKTLLDNARKLEGSVRNVGIHAAGLIISGDPLLEHIPICNAKDSEMVVTQYSMKPVETVGMLKIDFLGLKTLTTIQHAVDAIKESRGICIDWVNLPLDDQPTFALLNQGKTQGIFQLESPGMQDLAKQVHIDKFEEVIAVGALYRPGPMEMIPSFVQRKHGQEALDIDHPLMQNVLEETYGIMVYQEQVMQIASLLAGYSLGEGDILRRAMGKKDKDEMARQREKFRKGAIKNGIEEQTAMRIFDKVEKFASYGFNKSHAAAYGYLSYVTAFLKANYPSEWMAALMTSDKDDLSKITRTIRECHALSIPILGPDINESGFSFNCSEKGIRFALSAIKGVGDNVVEAILSERGAKGTFQSLFDFIKRLDMRKMGKKMIELLVEAGCFDFTNWTRPELIYSIESMVCCVTKEQEETTKGIRDFFTLNKKESPENRFIKPPKGVEEISRQMQLKREHELLGIYLNGHPLDSYAELKKRLGCTALCDLEALAAGSIAICVFIVEGMAIKLSSKSQRKFAILTIGDGGETLELPIWSDLYEEHASLLRENQMLCAVLHKDVQEDMMKLQCRWLIDLLKDPEEIVKRSQTAYELAKQQSKTFASREKKIEKMKEKEMTVPKQRLHLRLDADETRLSHILAIKEIFRSHPGDAAIEIEFINSQGSLSKLHIDAPWGVEPKSPIENRLKTLCCLKSIAWRS